MSKPVTHPEKPTPAPAKPGITDMLSQLSEAFETAEAKKAAHSEAHLASVKAIADAQKKFDAVKAEAEKHVADAAAEADAARHALETLRSSVNERVGMLTGQPSDPRVSVK